MNMTERKAILDLVLAAVQSLNDELPPANQLQLAEDTLLFGEGSSLDSLSLVSVIVDIETAVADQLGQPISLTDPALLHKAVMVPDRLTLAEVLTHFREVGEDFALIVNEYSLVVGLVTLNDVVSQTGAGAVNLQKRQGGALILKIGRAHV